jgi:hypothetical protein
MAAPTQAEYLSALRNFLKDIKDLNRLLKFELENADEPFLNLYLNMAFGFLNAIPPYIGPFTWGTFPIPNLLIHQATIECLISNSIVQARNELAYNNGGITVKIADGNRYMNLLQILYRATDMEISTLKQIKIAINIQNGYGGVSSPYSYLHGRSAVLNPNSILSG